MKTQLMRIKTEVPDCTATRQRLRSVLSDFFPTEKQMINAILNAYDENVEGRLTASNDRTLAALQLVKLLKSDYGMTGTSALLAVRSWCYILGYIDVGDVLEDIGKSQGREQNGSFDKHVPGNTVDIGQGIYKAGVDFPAGELCLQKIGTSSLSIFYGINKNPNRVGNDKNFMDKTYINIVDGQYLKLECFDSSANFVIRVTKMD